jgi:MFS family permease
MSQVNSIWQFYLFYGVIIGIGMSGFWIPLISPVSRWFVARRSLMTGIVICGLTLGQLIAPVIIGRLIEAYDWRLAYIIIGAVVLVVITVFAQFLKRDPGQVGRLPYGAENDSREMAAIDVSGYSLREAFRTYQFWLGFLILFCFGYSAFSITIHLVPHAIDLDISRVTASDMLAVNGGVGIIGNFLVGGLLADIIGNRKAFIIGFTISAVSLVWLIYTGEMWTLFLFAAVYGISMGSIGTSESPLIARLFGLKNHGLIYGVLGMGFTVGGAVGPLVTGYIYDIVKSYDDAFWVSAGFAALGLILTLALKPTPKMKTAL